MAGQRSLSHMISIKTLGTAVSVKYQRKTKQGKGEPVVGLFNVSKSVAFYAALG